MFVACGGGGIDKNDSPEEVTKKCVTLYLQGDEKYSDCVYFKSKEEKEEYKKNFLSYANDIKKDVEKQGGFKPIETRLLSKTSNEATVDCIFRYNNGYVDAKGNKVNLIKTDNGWYIVNPW